MGGYAGDPQVLARALGVTLGARSSACSPTWVYETPLEALDRQDYICATCTKETDV
jgi:hypothetical protein